MTIEKKHKGIWNINRISDTESQHNVIDSIWEETKDFVKWLIDIPTDTAINVVNSFNKCLKILEENYPNIHYELNILVHSAIGQKIIVLADDILDIPNRSDVKLIDNTKIKKITTRHAYELIKLLADGITQSQNNLDTLNFTHLDERYDPRWIVIFARLDEQLNLLKTYLNEQNKTVDLDILNRLSDEVEFVYVEQPILSSDLEATENPENYPSDECWPFEISAIRRMIEAHYSELYPPEQVEQLVAKNFAVLAERGSELYMIKKKPLERSSFLSDLFDEVMLVATMNNWVFWTFYSKEWVRGKWLWRILFDFIKSQNSHEKMNAYGMLKNPDVMKLIEYFEAVWISILNEYDGIVEKIVALSFNEEVQYIKEISDQDIVKMFHYDWRTTLMLEIENCEVIFKKQENGEYYQDVSQYIEDGYYWGRAFMVEESLYIWFYKKKDS